MKQRVVITGIGIIAPIGIGCDAFWHNCLKSNSIVAAIPEHWYNYAEFNSKLWSPLPDIDYSAYNINRIEKMQLDPSTMLALGSAMQALESANIRYTPKNEKKNTYMVTGIDKHRSGVFVGTGIGGLNTVIANISNHLFTPQKQELNRIRAICKNTTIDNETTEIISVMDENMKMPYRFNPLGVSMSMPNAISANIGIKYTFHGPNITFCCACAAGTVAIGHAFRAIQTGIMDLAIAGGVEYLADDFGGIFRGFDISKTLVRNCSDPQGANRPFDKKRSGFLFSEGGSALMILEELTHAQNRGVPIIAEITGFAETFDAYNIMIMDPDARDIIRMIHKVLMQAGLAPQHIDYINAHATGTEINDETEALVIEKIFGKRPLVNSTKSLIGHTIGASGAIEAAVTALSISNKTTHICNNLEDPIRDLNFVTEAKDFPIRKALTQSFAFGGHNAALVFEEYQKSK